MRILLIMPDAQMHKLRIGPHLRSMREAPLTLTTLAALTPPDVDLKLVDGSIDEIPMNEEADLVGISVITGCAPKAYSIAAHYRRRGIPVVLGGVHVTILPGEAAQHADCIVVGRAEKTWPELIEDFRAGQMKKVYREPAQSDQWLRNVPPPRRDLQRNNGYMVPFTVQATRGCKRMCDFCTVSAVWPSYLRRPVGDVIRDIRAVPRKTFAFNDVSLVDDPEYAKELFTALTPLQKRWGGLITADALKDGELLELMVRSGCKYLLIGFESENPAALKNIRKSFNKTHQYREIIDKLHERDITVQGCFVFGFDHDDNSAFERTVQTVLDLKIDIPRYSLYTPYPGTQLFDRLLAEKRIISFNWNDYDTMHVVIQPAQMTPEELYRGFKWAYRETFKMRHIIQRVARPSITAAINSVGNLAYRIFVRRLYGEARFAQPYTIQDPGLPPLPEHWQIPGASKESIACPT